MCLKSDGMLYPCIMSSLKLGKYTKVNRILTKKIPIDFYLKTRLSYVKNANSSIYAMSVVQ